MFRAACGLESSSKILCEAQVLAEAGVDIQADSTSHPSWLWASLSPPGSRALVNTPEFPATATGLEFGVMHRDKETKAQCGHN